jgi:polyhydroxyalkanoate synthesis regulator phasin
MNWFYFTFAYSMTALVQKIIYTSIGVASVTNEKFKELMEDLIQNNHFTEDEGKRIIDTFLVDLRQHVDDVNGTFQLKADELLQKFGLSSIHSLKDDVENYVNDVKRNPALLLKLPSKK